MESNFCYKLRLFLNNKSYNELVFLCIGTDRIIGDSFGPLVGSKLVENLERKNISNINVYGTMDRTISYTNVKEEIENIRKKHTNNPCIICIDSALSSKESIGKIFVEDGKTTLGSGLNKKKIEIGDISIKGVVGQNRIIPKYNFQTLQNIHLNEVLKLVQVTTNGILEVIL